MPSAIDPAVLGDDQGAGRADRRARHDRARPRLAAHVVPGRMVRVAPFFTKIGFWRKIGLGLAPPPQVVLAVMSASTTVCALAPPATPASARATSASREFYASGWTRLLVVSSSRCRPSRRHPRRAMAAGACGDQLRRRMIFGTPSNLRMLLWGACRRVDRAGASAMAGGAGEFRTPGAVRENVAEDGDAPRAPEEDRAGASG